MPYELYQFGSVVLPAAMPESDLGTAETWDLAIDLPGGGAWDPLGTEVARAKSQLISKRAIIHDATPVALKTTFNALRALNGQRDRLWRRWDDDSTEWCWARMKVLPATRTIRNLHHQELTLQWRKLSPCWYGTRHGGGWMFDSGVLFDTGYTLDSGDWHALTTTSNYITVTNGGNAMVANAVITVNVPSGRTPITRVIISVDTICEWDWTGTIAANTSLVMDCGAWTFKNNAVDAYSGFYRSVATNYIDDLLRLQPGSNSVRVRRTGGDAYSQVAFTFYDGWQ
jgi:hypothetical protein